MKEDMIIAFETAVESHGQDAAEKAAEASIEAYNNRSYRRNVGRSVRERAGCRF